MPPRLGPRNRLSFHWAADRGPGRSILQQSTLGQWAGTCIRCGRLRDRYWKPANFRMWHETPGTTVDVDGCDMPTSRPRDSTASVRI